MRTFDGKRVLSDYDQTARESFMRAHNLRESFAGQPQAARLRRGQSDRWGGLDDCLDHQELYRRPRGTDRQLSYVLVGHPYDLDPAGLDALAATHRLAWIGYARELSWYYPGESYMVTLVRTEDLDGYLAAEHTRLGPGAAFGVRMGA